jgi:hypothetical protein
VSEYEIDPDDVQPKPSSRFVSLDDTDLSDDTAARRAADHRDRLLRARAHALLPTAEEDWSKALAPAAEELLAAFTELTADDDFWQDVEQSARMDLQTEDRLQISELLNTDLTRLLDVLGYTYPPPPPSAELAAEVTDAFSLLYESDGPARASVVLEARRSLIFYCLRLRQLLRRHEVGTRTGGQLLASVKRGALAAAPAILAATVKSALFPPSTALNVGEAIIVGVRAGAQEAVSQGVKSAATAAITYQLAGEEQVASLVWDDATDGQIKLFRFMGRQMLRDLDGVETPDASTRNRLSACSIYQKRRTYAVLGQLAVKPLLFKLLKPELEAVVDALNALDDWLALPFASGWSEVATCATKTLRDAEERLSVLQTDSEHTA